MKVFKVKTEKFTTTFRSLSANNLLNFLKLTQPEWVVLSIQEK